MICAARNEADGFRGDSWAEGREQREDGADDRCLLTSGRSLPGDSRIRRRCGTSVPLRGVCPKRCGSDEGRPLPTKSNAKLLRINFVPALYRCPTITSFQIV